MDTELHETLADPAAEIAPEVLHHKEKICFIRAIVGDPRGVPILDRGLAEQVAKIRSQLKDRELDILRKRFGLNGADEKGVTLEEIGREYRVTRERIRQIEAKVLLKLRAGLERFEGRGEWRESNPKSVEADTQLLSDVQIHCIDPRIAKRLYLLTCVREQLLHG
jgi:hypothetical protein